MTKEEILGMGVGEELDVLVALEVMKESAPRFIPENALDLQLAGSPVKSSKGNWLCLCGYDEGDMGVWRSLPFSTDITYAWQVVEKLIELGFRPSLKWKPPRWICKLWNCLEMGEAKEAPEAICKAALLCQIQK